MRLGGFFSFRDLAFEAFLDTDLLLDCKAFPGCSNRSDKVCGDLEDFALLRSDTVAGGLRDLTLPTGSDNSFGDFLDPFSPSGFVPDELWSMSCISSESFSSLLFVRGAKRSFLLSGLPFSSRLFKDRPDLPLNLFLGSAFGDPLDLFFSAFNLSRDLPSGFLSGRSPDVGFCISVKAFMSASRGLSSGRGLLPRVDRALLRSLRDFGSFLLLDLALDPFLDAASDPVFGLVR